MEPIRMQYTYTKELARRAATRFFWRYAQGATILVVVVTLAGAVRAVMGTTDALTIVFLAIPFAYLAYWLSYYRRAQTVVKTLYDPVIDLLVDDDGLTWRNRVHTSATKWAGMKEVWFFPELWLFFPYGSGSSFTTVPTAALPAGAAEAIAAKLREHGTRVVG